MFTVAGCCTYTSVGGAAFRQAEAPLEASFPMPLCADTCRLVTSTLLFVLESLVSGVVGETGERGHEPRGETTESAALAAKDNTRREEGVSRPTSGERDRSGASDQGRSEQHRDH